MGIKKNNSIGLRARKKTRIAGQLSPDRRVTRDEVSEKGRSQVTPALETMVRWTVGRRSL